MGKVALTYKSGYVLLFSQNTVLEKKVKEVEGDFFAPTDFGAAFLGPNLWDKTYGDDDFNFKLEYMELDEFLSENGLPMSSVDNVLTIEQQKEEDISKKDCEEVDSNVSDVNYQSDSEIPGKGLKKKGKKTWSEIFLFQWCVVAKQSSAFRLKFWWLNHQSVGLNPGRDICVLKQGT